MNNETVQLLLKLRKAGAWSNLSALILLFLREGPMFLTDLTDLTEETYSTVWFAMTKLQNQGLIEVSGSSGGSKLYDLTEKSRKDFGL